MSQFSDYMAELANKPDRPRLISAHDAAIAAGYRVIPTVPTEGLQQVIYQTLYDQGVTFDSAHVVPLVEANVLDYLRAQTGKPQ